MGTLLDASALIAFLDDEPAAPEVAVVLGSRAAAIPALNLAEAVQRILRRSDATLGELRQLIESLDLPVLPLTDAHAWRAGELRARHYAKVANDVSLADCCLVAVATPADVIASTDANVLRMATAEGVATLPLPDSRGRLPRI